MLKKKKTTASGKLVLVKSVRRTRSHRMKFCVQRGLGALPSTSKRRGKSQRDFLLCGPVCINTGIACRFLAPVRNPSEAVVFDAAYSVTLRLAHGRLTVSASAPRRTRTARHGTLPLRERP